MFFSNLEIILEIKLENFIISFFDISFNLLYIYIYIYIYTHHNLKNLMNNSNSYLMSILCKSSTNKYMIIVRNFINKIIKNMIIFFFNLQNLGIKIVFYLKNYYAQCVGLQLVDN